MVTKKNRPDSTQDFSLKSSRQLYARENETPDLIRVKSEKLSETRKRTQAGLKTSVNPNLSDTFFELLSSLTFDLYFRIRFFPDFKFDYVSPSITDITGYPAEKFYSDVRFVLSLIHPNDKPYYERLFKYRRVFSGPRELRVIHKDGRIVWLELHSIFIFDAKDRPIAQEGIARVITERKREEIALRESKERLEAFFNNSPAGIFMLGADEVFVDANISWASMMGYRIQDLLGGSLIPNVYKEDLEVLTKKMTDIRSGQIREFRSETRFAKKDGSIFWADFYISVLNDSEGKVKFLVGIAADITERKIIENQLVAYRGDLEQKIRERTYELLFALERNKSEIKERRRAEKNLRIRLRYEKGLADFAQTLLLAESVSEESLTDSLIHLLKASGSNRIYIFENFEDPKDGLCMRLMNEVCDDDSSRRIENQSLQHIPYSNGFAHWSEVLSRHEPLIRSEDSFTPDERQLLLHGKVASMLALPIWAESTWYGFIGFDSVRRDHWWNEEDVRLLRTAAAILGAYKERKKMEIEMIRRHKLDSLGLLAGGIAHDFNNFLSGILLSTSIAKRYIEPGSEAFEVLNDAEQATKRASNLSNQLVTFTKGGDPVRSLISISKLLKETVDFALTGSGVSCALDVPDDLWFADVDKGQVSQVIHNIVLNALQAMPNGGNLIVKANNVLLKTDNEMDLDPGKYLKIFITDTGVGIPEENLSNIFDPYYTTKERGSGLGLTISYSIIKKHKGFLGVNSIEQHGSTFFLYLPATQTMPGTLEETGDSIKRGKGKILVMDDEEIVLSSASKGLKLLGYEVSSVKNGAEAVDCYKKAITEKTPFTAAILDLTISGAMGGKETADLIFLTDPKAKIVVSSGYSKDPIMSDYKKYGFKACLMKPYTIEELSDAIASIIRKS
jgi:PAS domain S-box-containing protein